MNTTLNKIRNHAPCADGWRKLLKGLNKAAADDEPLALTTILALNGLDDALWALRTADCDRESRMLAVAYARQVQHLMTDPRSVGGYAKDAAEAESFADAASAARKASHAARAAWAATWTASNADEAATWDAAWVSEQENMRKKQVELFKEIFG